ncbi:hypothetical protein OAG1_10900 [Agarivorans sp. OAG1]|uniref:hypothetical protein n=1 Tax=Agarivorans TaxID=261825 RepID=UPI00058AC928|nr:hypothetical protein [Agarivorans albus]BEU02290.1 hypothetical protein OAG1_10900 [Agarivorans sp. OAG1]
MKHLRKIIPLFLALFSFQCIAEASEKNNEIFSNKYFYVEMPAGWKIDESQDRLSLISEDGTKSLIIVIFNVKKPTQVTSFSKERKNFTTLRDEHYNHESNGYAFCEGFFRDGNIEYKAADFILLNNDVQVYLSLGDYNCNDESCSLDDIDTIIATFYSIDSSGKKLKFSEFRESQNNL